MDENDIYSRLGSVETKTDSLQGEMTEFKNDVKEGFAEIKQDIKNHNTCVSRKLDNINNAFNQTKGGWKVIVFFGGIASTAGGIIVAIASYIGNLIK